MSVGHDSYNENLKLLEGDMGELSVCVCVRARSPTARLHLIIHGRFRDKWAGAT